jgi:hypothetical protein
MARGQQRELEEVAASQERHSSTEGGLQGNVGVLESAIVVQSFVVEDTVDEFLESSVSSCLSAR